MQRSTLTIIGILWMLSCSLVFGQTTPLIKSESKLYKKYSMQEGDAGWVYFNGRFHVKDLVREMRPDLSVLGLGVSDALRTKHGIDLLSFVERKTDWKDEVIRVDQTHDGLPVEGAQLLIIHDTDGIVRTMHGKLIRNLPSAGPTINEALALRKALDAIRADKYLWEDPDWEKQIKDDLQDPQATHYPKGKLMYARIIPSENLHASNYTLVYAFEINTLSPSRDQRIVMVDARNGSVIRNTTMLREAWGTVNTLYDGTRGFVTMWRGFPNNDYVLKDHDRGDKIHTPHYLGKIHGELG